VTAGYHPWQEVIPMASTHVDAIDRSVQKTHEWLNDLAAELGTDERTAWRVLRAYLQVLRDRLTIDEAAQLAAQLPQLLRGVFYEGFDPGRQPEKIRDRDVFLTRLGERAEVEDAAAAAAAVTRVLRRHIADGEIDEVLSPLPAEIRKVLDPGSS
jgi:uncharacterized protein (DUF2267 family)